MNHLGPTLRRTRRKDRSGWRTALALAASLLVNLLIVSQLDASWLGLGKAADVRSVDVAPLAATDWEANRAVRDPKAAPPPKVAPPARPPPPGSDGQVVEVAPSQDSTPPKETRFLSDKNNTVAKETRSRYARAGYGQVAPVPTAAAQAAGGAPKGSGGKAERERAGKEGAKPSPQPSPEKLATGLPLPAGDGPEPSATAAADEGSQRGADGQGGERATGRFDPRLSVPSETFARLLGGPSPDRLDGVDEGDGTFLNTREFKYATYFNRIKQAVSSTWAPQQALDLRDPNRTMYGFKDMVTLLTVTLDDAGGVKDLAVQRSSGVDFLDRTAIDAFKKAQPFSNPPPGLVDGRGEIRFTFGFYLEVGRSGLRVYRGVQP